MASPPHCQTLSKIEIPCPKTVVDVYTDVATDHQLDLQLNAMAVLWESRKEAAKSAAAAVQPVHIHLVWPLGENRVRAKDLGCPPPHIFRVAYSRR